MPRELAPCGGFVVLKPCLRLFPTALALALAGCSSGKAPTSLDFGGASLVLSKDGSTITFQRGGSTLLTFGTDAFQLGTVNSLTYGSPSFDPFWLNNSSAPQPAGLTWRTMPSNGAMKLLKSSATELLVEADLDGATVTVDFTTDPSGRVSGLLMPEFTNGLPLVGFIRLRFTAGATEGFYGLGEWGDTVNQRGQVRPMQIELDATLESGYDENHTPIPLLLGTNGWGLFVQSDRVGMFDVASQDSTTIEITYGTADASSAGLQFHLFSEANPLDLLKHYYDITGYPRLPATWALGPILWRDQLGNATAGAAQAQFTSDATTLRSLHLATSAMWFDRPYATGVETFDFNPSWYPDPATMLQNAHDLGYRFAVWQAPYAGTACSEDPAPVQFAYATAHDFFPPVTSVKLNNWSEPLDFTNTAAYQWWTTNLETYTNMGVEGFKLDYGEDIAPGLLGVRNIWQFANGSDERTMHYGYTLLYHQIHAALLPMDGGFLLTRTGRWGDQVHGMIIWPGDLDSTFAQQGDPIPGYPPGSPSPGNAVGGLPSALDRGLSVSVSGFPFYASDTGGYRNHKDPTTGMSICADHETWLRWVEMNAVQTAMEVGDSCSELPFDRDAPPGGTPAITQAQQAQELTDFQLYASLHMRLFPYVWTYAQQIATAGRPILRPFGLVYPQMNQHPSDQYLLGDSILVAPVVAAASGTGTATPEPGPFVCGAGDVGGLPPATRNVALPPGNWVGWWDGKTQAGGSTISVTVDVDTLPLYIAEGGIVPMLRDTIDTTSPVSAANQATIDSFVTDAGVLWVRVAPSATQTSFQVYDGATIGQQKQAGGSISLTFTPGSSPVFTKGALFEVIGIGTAPNSVTNNSAALTAASSLSALKSATDGWFYDSCATGGTVWVKVPGLASVVVQ
jgi:alpha-D-xyloside xylohydrolase